MKARTPTRTGAAAAVVGRNKRQGNRMKKQFLIKVRNPFIL
jgi:hypothetical protein